MCKHIILTFKRPLYVGPTDPHIPPPNKTTWSDIIFSTYTACPKKSVPVMKGSTYPVHDACHAPGA